MYSRKYIRPAMAAGSARSERSVLPPDYAGIAFRASDDRTPQDFPETVIPADQAALAPSIDPPSEERDLPAEEDLPAADDGMAFADSPVTEEDRPTFLSPDLSSEDKADEPIAFETPAFFNAEERPAEPRDQPADSELPTSPSDGEAGSGRTPLEWLRALKMEDLLLMWMLLMLLYGEPSEEIDLLLGLLLFAGR